MGFAAFAVLAGLEIALVVRVCRKKPDKKTWQRERTAVRAVEAAVFLLCLLFSRAQKWRFAPALAAACALLAASALAVWLARRGEGRRRAAAAVLSCVLNVFVFGLLLAPAFLFTDYGGLPVSGGYRIGQTSAILTDESRPDPFERDGSFREVPVHFYYPADAAEGERFPLAVFSHGAFGYYESNASTCMELASNGYVVAALDHPHHAFFTRDTDGKTVPADAAFVSAAMNLNDETDRQTQFSLYTEWMALRVPDMNFAVDAIKAAAEAGAADRRWFVADGDAEAVRAVLRMTDASKIGLMGHSMGGAASAELGRERGDVSAVVDMDGTMLGEYTGVQDGEMLVRSDPYPVPVLDFRNWTSYIDIGEYEAQGFRYPNAEVLRHAADGFAVGIRGTEHMDFTDLPLLSPFLGNMLGSGERGAEETMTIVNSLVLRFFDCYLKGKGTFTAQEIY